MYSVAQVNQFEMKNTCFEFVIKGTLAQIWKSANIFVFIYEENAEDFTFKYLLRFEICTPETCEEFVYKHSEAIEYAKN